MLTTSYITSTTTSPHLHLDLLIPHSVRSAFPEIIEDQQAGLRTVMGTIALLFDPLVLTVLSSASPEEGTVH